MQRRVSLPGKDVILIGTAHISQDSVDEVAAVIENEQPDRVGVELDQQRYEALTEEDKWQDLDITAALRQGKGHLLLLHLVLSIYQRQIGEDIGVAPGSEMVAAITAAETRGIPFELIDRDVQQTMQDAMQSLTLLEKYRLLSSFIASFFIDDEELDAAQVEALKEQDMLTALINELGADFPSLKHVFLDKRDAYMANRLQDMDGDTIVAVVGAAHVNGIADRLERRVTTPVTPPVEKQYNLLKIAKYGVPTLIIALFLSIFLTQGVAAVSEAAAVWFLANGVLAATGAIIAKAHPATVLVSFIAAPFTSLNPALPAGLVAAYTEHRLRPPTVGDLEAIGQTDSFSAFWTNAALRLLLIFLLVNMGSAIASYAGGGYLANLLLGA